MSGMSTANRQEYTGSREDLIAQGYTPCGQCNHIAEAARGFAPGGFSNVQQQQFTGRTQSAVIWGGQLRSWRR